MKTQLHGSAVAIGARGLLILGASGSGKSSLASGLIALGAELVADDRVDVKPDGAGGLALSAPKRLAGLLEIRGFGPVRLAARKSAPLVLIADLDEAAGERLPASRDRVLSGISCPVMLCREWLEGRADLPALLTCILRAEEWPDPEQFMPGMEESG